MDQDTALSSSDPITPSRNRPFDEIPLEILHRITNNLTTPDLGNLRLTCRSVERCLDHAFINEFFTRKKFMFTKFSLETLRDISQSRLAPYLRQLDFGLERIYRIEDIFHISSNPDFARPVAKYKDLESENKLWVFSGRRHQTLMAAFSGLKNLKTIMIRENNSKTRFRDGTNYEWNSYGLVTLSKETGLSISEIHQGAGNKDETAHEIFICIMQVLAEAQITAVKDIEFVGHRHIRLEDQSFATPPSIQAAMVPILENLEKLHVHPNWSGTGSLSLVGGEMGDPHLMKFLRRTVNLRDLRINGLFGVRGKPSTQVFLKCLTNSDRAEVLPKLQALSLSGLLDQEELTNLIKRFSETLVSLQLWAFVLTKESYDANQEHPGPYAWNTFFSQCQDIKGLSNLRHVKFGNLFQSLKSAEPTRKLTFDGKRLIEYTGPDWKSFVNEKVLEIEH